MTRGKETCRILKEIRQQIAKKNDIEYITSECNFQGECQGTCPKCESELKYLENELHKRTQLGKVVAIAGISLGLASTFPACNFLKQENTQEIATYDGLVVPGEIDSLVWQEYDDDDTTILVISEILPEYIGGEEARIKFLTENLVYPKEAREKGIEGRVTVGFVVEKDGSLTNFAILRGVDRLLDEEVLRVVKLMPKWISGEQRGKPVRVQYNMPITFTLN